MSHHPDPMRLARSLQLRELIALIFNDLTPWGESLPVQVLADYLEEAGHQEAADAVRGRIVEWAENRDWQLVDWVKTRDGANAPIEFNARFRVTSQHENPFRKRR